MANSRAVSAPSIRTTPMRANGSTGRVASATRAKTSWRSRLSAAMRAIRQSASSSASPPAATAGAGAGVAAGAAAAAAARGRAVMPSF